MHLKIYNMESILINIGIWVLTILGYIIYNLYSKNIKLERMVYERDQTLNILSNTINESEKILKEIDTLGAFKSDDEIGFFFNTVKSIQSTLNQFATKN
jgi:hypothetical protein